MTPPRWAGVAAWPWDSDVVHSSLSSRAGQQTLKFTANVDESDDQFATRLARDLIDRRWGQDDDTDIGD